MRIIWRDCGHCGNQFSQPDDPGRKRRFCADACKQAAAPCAALTARSATAAAQSFASAAAAAIRKQCWCRGYSRLHDRGLQAAEARHAGQHGAGGRASLLPPARLVNTWSQ